jgi:prepilin-type N-terminal cleavage/methylation domain-containing protein
MSLAPPPTPPRGLTLIEVMVVVALVGILLALVAPSVRGMISSQRVRSINAELVTDLQFARSEAARRNRDVFIRFRSADSCYTIYVVEVAGSCDCRKTPGVDVCTGGPEEIKTVKLSTAQGVSFSASNVSGQQTLRFEKGHGTILPDGIFDPAASAPRFGVQITGVPRGQLRTDINMSGRPTVCSPDGSIAQVPAC